MTIKLKRKTKKVIVNKLRQLFTGALAIYMLLTSLLVFSPLTQTYALTGGPSQPEVESFEPIGTSDMVDLFSGDMTYNIPLLDVEGYPINISYHSGVTMDQEASWVGLGWNINVGTINRSLRGLPDDFNGDEIITETSMKVNRTFGVRMDGDFEFLGKEIGSDSLPIPLPFSLGVGLGINYNNYNGIGFDLSIAPSLNFSKENGLGGSIGLGLNSSSSNGLTVSPSVSLSANEEIEKKKNNSLSATIGSSFNSRMGLTGLSIGVNASLSDSKNKGKQKNGRNKSLSTGAGVADASFNIGQPTHIPTITNSMKSFAISGRFKTGLEFFGLDGGVTFTGSYSEQRLKQKEVTSKTYGYFYSEKGQLDNQAKHDFNRDNDGSFQSNTPNIALTNYTYDIFSVSGQGAGGSYRAFRGDIGYVYDNYAQNTSSSIPVTVELSPGGLFHGGTQIGITQVRSASGPWVSSNTYIEGTTGNNSADNFFRFKAEKPYNNYESFYLREANEMSVSSDPNFYNKIGGNKAVRIKLDRKAKFMVDAVPQLEGNGFTSTTQDLTNNYRGQRAKRNTTVVMLTNAEVKKNMALNDFKSGTVAAVYNKSQHIGEITSLSTDGMRYVYGQPAYNKVQKEVTFAVGKKTDGTSYTGSLDFDDGLIEYTPNQTNSIDNEWGIDNYYNSVKTPSYAHSYLLTAVISNDYVDVDGIKGPSDGDIGAYNKFSYTHIPNYKWRVPFEQNTAAYNEGLKGDFEDDKANYIYGEKELFYLDKIETKNFIAIFYKSNRVDGFGVLNENGGLDDAIAQQKLDSICLYTKPEYKKFVANSSYELISLKTVHFEYNYSLCPGVPNSENFGEETDNGKLTLKKVWFTYRDSFKGKLNPYVFEYDEDFNFDYNLKAYNRWGGYKPNTATTGAFNEPTLATFEYPYIEQNDANIHDYAAAWTLTTINLPSGGAINLEYESDDYAYVQNKKAMEMVKIVKNGDDEGDPEGALWSVASLSSEDEKNRKIFFAMADGTSINDYIAGIDQLYFRCLMEFDDGERYDYVSGYAQIQNSTVVNISGQNYGALTLKPVSFSDKSGHNAAEYNPIALAGSQFGQLHLPKYVWDSPAFNENQTFAGELFTGLAQVFINFADGFKNPNKAIWDKERGKRIVLGKSWIRLNDVDNKKYGGGSRVKKVFMNDNWSNMTHLPMNDADYGQEYSYTLENGQSSGVASYEPQLGGDENPFKQPVFFSEQKRMAPDPKYYQEEPLGEAFFPSASVGYSKVTVKNLTRNDVSRNATGSVVHEFYTAKDFPTKVSRTAPIKFRHKSDAFSISSLLNISARDFATVSQGFVIETNDMHGKPKSQAVYQENQTKPITKVEYFYQSDNNAKVIYPNGQIGEATIGVDVDMVADFRESSTKVSSASVNLNLDAIPLAVLPITIPSFWPAINSDLTSFKSASVTKVVQRFGILERTVATDLGSVVETKNLAYDAETGQVLLTETATNFNDKIYSLSFPAYWHYDLMGPAYKNIRFNGNISLSSGVASTSLAENFAEGDELMIIKSGVYSKAWVTEKSGNSITLELFTGASPTDGVYNVTVLRSGRRNMQSQMMASITTLTNPLNSFTSNFFENVLQASAIEFIQDWRTSCDCYLDEGDNLVSSNPYVMGKKGSFRPKASYLHLSDRKQSNYNGNTNIRRDGVFESFSPYYKVNDLGIWEIFRKDWTYTAEVTEFSPTGNELENRDALGRYSTATFGFNQTLAKSVAANARYRQIGFTSFEDDEFSVCADNHFKFDASEINRTHDDSHSGRTSIRVNASNSVKFSRSTDWCDPEGCQLEFNLTTTADMNGVLIVIITTTNGTGSVVIDYNMISGEPSVYYSDDLHIKGVGTYTIEFEARDAKGCIATTTLKVIDGAMQ